MGDVRHWQVKNAHVEEFAAATEVELLEAILVWFRDRADTWTLHSIAVEYRADEHLYTGTVLCEVTNNPEGGDAY